MSNKENNCETLLKHKSVFISVFGFALVVFAFGIITLSIVLARNLGLLDYSTNTARTLVLGLFYTLCSSKIFLYIIRAKRKGYILPVRQYTNMVLFFLAPSLMWMLTRSSFYDKLFGFILAVGCTAWLISIAGFFSLYTTKKIIAAIRVCIYIAGAICILVIAIQIILMTQFTDSLNPEFVAMLGEVSLSEYFLIVMTSLLQMVIPMIFSLAIIKALQKDIGT